MPPSYPPQGGPGGASGTPGVDGTTAAGGGDGTEKRAVEEHGTDGSSAAPERPRKGGLLRETVIVLVTALVLSVLIKTFLVQAFFIPSSSMEDTLAIGDRIMVNKVATATDDIQRGDIVVFVDPGSWLPEAQADTRAPWQRAMGDVLTFVGLLPQDAGHPGPDMGRGNRLRRDIACVPMVLVPRVEDVPQVGQHMRTNKRRAIHDLGDVL